MRLAAYKWKLWRLNSVLDLLDLQPVIRFHRTCLDCDYDYLGIGAQRLQNSSYRCGPLYPGYIRSPAKSGHSTIHSGSLLAGSE